MIEEIVVTGEKLDIKLLSFDLDGRDSGEVGGNLIDRPQNMIVELLNVVGLHEEILSDPNGLRTVSEFVKEFVLEFVFGGFNL